MDILGPLSETDDKNKYILIVGDYFTKWTEAFAIKDQSAETVASTFVKEFVCRYGFPRQIHIDQGKTFEAKLFQEICALLDIDKTRTTPYWPRSDGMVERFNRTLENMLCHYVSSNQKNWDQKLPFMMMAYRSTVYDSTGFSPNQMMMGRKMNLPIDVIFGGPWLKLHTKILYIIIVNLCRRLVRFMHKRGLSLERAVNGRRRTMMSRPNL